MTSLNDLLNIDKNIGVFRVSFACRMNNNKTLFLLDQWTILSG